MKRKLLEYHNEIKNEKICPLLLFQNDLLPRRLHIKMCTFAENHPYTLVSQPIS